MIEAFANEPICSRILVVDNEPKILDSLRQLLSDLAHVSCASDGEEALALIREHAPDLILLDVDMPGTNGFDTCKAIKKEHAHQDIPVIFITGNTDSKTEISAFDAGAVDCISKPFNIPTLRARVQTHLLLKQRSVQLRRSHDLLASITVHAPVQFYQYRLYPDGRSTCPFVSESVRLTCGLSPEALSQDALPWLSLVHPEDQPALQRAIDESARTLAPFRLEYRVRLPENGTRWMRGESYPQKLDDGSVLWHGYIQDVSEQKNTQLLLEEKEHLLRLCIENSPAPIMMLDRDMRHVAVSRRFIEDYRLGDTQIIGRSHYEVFANIPERWRLIHQRGLAGESLQCDEDVYIHPDGAKDFTRWEIKPWYSGKEVGGIILFTEMITARKHAEQKERRLKSLYRALSETNDAILRLQDEKALFSVICRIAVEFGELPLAWIGIPDAQGRIVPAAMEGKAQDYLLENYLAMSTANAPQGRGRVGIAYREMKTSISNDISKDVVSLPFVQRAQHYGLRSIGAFPIVSQQKPYAVFAVYSDQTDAFDEEIVLLLEDMTANIGYALDNFAREAARRQAERALQLTQFSVEKAADPIFWLSSDGRILFANEAACGHLGYTREELLNLAVSDFCPSCTPEVWAALSKKMGQEKTGVFEMVHRTKDGRSIPVEITANCTVFEGEEFHFSSVRDISERKQAEEVIWRQANFDALTGLPNRYYFAERLEQEIARSHRNNLQFALLFIDLDRFKEINDALGHGMGDMLLQQAAERIRSCVRKTDIAARLGGDEFIVLLPEFIGQNNVDRLVSAMVKKLSEPFMMEGEAAHISASIGIAFYPHDASDSDALLRYADQAMYVAKNKGRNRYSYYDASLQEAANTRRRLIRHLHAALENSQFEVFYQPIIDLATGSIRKAEALLRWHHPEHGMINPAEFIPLAEETGMIVEIGDWVFRQASGTVKRIREHHPGFQVSINKSPVQFLNDGTRYKTWLDDLRKLNIHDNGIAIEVTENVLMDDTGLTEDKLKAFRSAGMQISLDDFGTGYSSLSYLQKFEFDHIKIDKCFVCNLHAGSSAMALCEAMIAMAHSLGIKVIAEGVETGEQRRLLEQAGCDYAQGYLFARPMPEKRLYEFLFNEDCIRVGT